MSTLRDAIAIHRFGLGEPSAEVTRGDAEGWLVGQIGPADAARGSNLLSTAQGLALIEDERRKRAEARHPAPGTTAEQLLAGHYRETTVADVRSRLVSAALSPRPFAERLVLFWANHFTVSLAKGSVRGLAGAFERDAIRPHIAGRFETLLVAAVTHPAMLRYLDNQVSAGPRSRAVAVAARRAARAGEAPRVSGLNENLAREVLELHTLGVDGGYTQADVTEFARVLTGWRVDFRGNDPDDRFDANWHDPGRKTVLGKSYGEGPDALRAVLHDLTLHPSTARFVATKLARHFVADTPPPALVDRLAQAYRRSEGDLAMVYRALLDAPEAWAATPQKLKTPEEFVISSVRMLEIGEAAFQRAEAGGIGALGQRLHAAPSPAGWSDFAADWLGPEALWKRIEWTHRVADRLGSRVDARRVADTSLGPILGAATRQQIERAADGPQALALLLLAPEFQRR